MLVRVADQVRCQHARGNISQIVEMKRGSPSFYVCLIEVAWVRMRRRAEHGFGIEYSIF